jgi:hypothetical protein
MVVIIVEIWARLVARFLLFRSDFDKVSKASNESVGMLGHKHGSRKLQHIFS